MITEIVEVLVNEITGKGNRYEKLKKGAVRLNHYFEF